MESIFSIIASIGLGGIILKWAWSKFIGSASKKDVEKELSELNKKYDALIAENKKNDEKFQKAFWIQLNALRVAFVKLTGVLSEKLNDKSLRDLYKAPEEKE
jgi:hypothetical protein